MAESVVSFLLGEINRFVKEEKKLLDGIRDEVKDIGHELEQIKGFLRAAETTEMIEEPSAQLCDWVKEVREIAFEMEDVLDEFTLRLVRDRRVGCSITRYFKNMKYRHQIASQVQAIKSKLMKAFKRRERFKLEVPDQVSSFATANNLWYEQRGDALLLEEAELVSIDAPKRQMIEWLVKDDSALKVISVEGMGGLGKTTLVKKVYDNVEVQKHFNSRAWITVSQSFEIKELLRDIISQLFKEAKQPTPQGMETMNSSQLKEIIKKFLQKSKCLVVLDDIWRVEAWDAIKNAFPQSDHGNRVIQTTRNHEVAEAPQATFRGEVYPLKFLSFEMSWKLFCKKTFQEQECPQHLMGIAQSIGKRCEGLPLAVVAISGVLATKRNNTIDEWEMVKSNLGGELESNKLGSVKKILSLSYYDLPFHLKACLMYFSICPEDYQIYTPDLIRLWIAEGFVEEHESKTMEEVAESYLNELICRNLIQLTSTYADGSVQECRIHDLLREVILSKSKDQSFALTINEQNKCCREKNRRLVVDRSLGNMRDKGRRLGLRSLLVFGVSDFSLTSFGGDLRLVKVLELKGTNLEVFPIEITKLYHLRHLGLRATNVRDIPASIGKLKNLEILDLRDTFVTKLPATIVNLVCLRHLMVRGKEQVGLSLIPASENGFEAISGIGCLKLLQVLLRVEVKRGNGIIEESGTLNQLRTLQMVIKLKREDGGMLCSTIEKLTNLRQLFIKSSIDSETEIMDLQNISSPPQFLRWLKLEGRLEKVPHWIISLSNLSVLTLIGSRLRENVLEVVQALPNLLCLALLRAFEGDELHFKSGGFQKLKELWLRELGELRQVEVEMGAMPCLRFLGIANVPNLENVPLGIENLTTLKHLELTNVSDNLIEKIIEANGGQEFWRLKRVSVFKLKDGEWIKCDF